MQCPVQFQVGQIRSLGSEGDGRDRRLDLLTGGHSVPRPLCIRLLREAL